MQPFRIVISQNQRSIKLHMTRAGWRPVFEQGRPRVNNLEGEELLNGKALGPVEAELHQMRSIDMLDELAGGEFDVAVVGSDCVEERFNPRFKELGRYDYGRLLGGAPRPRLELVALDNSTIATAKDIPAGTIIHTERPRVTVIALTEQGVTNFLIANHYDFKYDASKFREKLIATGKIGINKIEGAGPGHLFPANPDRYLLVMVSETGETLADNDLRVISKLRDIDTVLLTHKDAYEDPLKRDHIRQFAWDMNEAFNAIKREYEGRSGLEREPM